MSLTGQAGSAGKANDPSHCLVIVIPVSVKHGTREDCRIAVQDQRYGTGAITSGLRSIRTQAVCLSFEGDLMQVFCPHCNAVLLNDTTTANRVVSCLVCKQVLQMPPLEPIPVNDAESSGENESAIDTGSVAGHYAKQETVACVKRTIWAR